MNATPPLYTRRIFLNPNTATSTPCYKGKNPKERVQILTTVNNKTTRLVDGRIFVETPDDATVNAIIKQRLSKIENRKEALLVGTISFLFNSILLFALGLTTVKEPSQRHYTNALGVIGLGITHYTHLQWNTTLLSLVKDTKDLQLDPTIDIIQARDDIYQKGFQEAYRLRNDKELPTNLILQQDEITDLYEQEIHDLARLANNYLEKTSWSDTEISAALLTLCNIQHIRPDWIAYAFPDPSDPKRELLVTHSKNIYRAERMLAVTINTCQQFERNTLEQLSLREETYRKELTVLFEQSWKEILAFAETLQPPKPNDLCINRWFL